MSGCHFARLQAIRRHLASTQTVARGWGDAVVRGCEWTDGRGSRVGRRVKVEQRRRVREVHGDAVGRFGVLQVRVDRRAFALHRPGPVNIKSPNLLLRPFHLCKRQDGLDIMAPCNLHTWAAQPVFGLPQGFAALRPTFWCTHTSGSHTIIVPRCPQEPFHFTIPILL